MMTTLLESSAPRRPRPGRWTIASIAVHAALIAGAVALTTQAPRVIPADPEREPVFYAPVPPAPTTGEPAPAGPRVPGVAAIPWDPIIVPPVPTIDVSRPFTTTIVPGDIFARPRETPGASAGTSGGGVHTAATVDRLAAPLPGTGQPEYPRALRTAGLEGMVVVTFVVDSTGRADPASITITSATHPLFADAVRRWLTRTRYAPAAIRGRTVNQLVQQEIAFALAR